uniref:Anaerobic ribonucleoside triphosphate reductase n=1 Tax=Siphoviridae sp. ctrpg19 TaxID=2826481 RepID=A0A8S5MJY3_9CAUD|nr:MAG TPA: anaerobic ribonucleoside triphosphate reductase [Siphoviridae sp. ctrpg19]
MFIVKRNGKREKFDSEKIKKALEKANLSVPEEDRISQTIINNIANKVEQLADEHETMFTVEDIQNAIEDYLITANKFELTRACIKYRYIKAMAKNKYAELMDAVAKKISGKDVVNQNANLDEKSFGGRLGETTSLIMKQYALDYCVSPTTRDNHINNMIYIHDQDHLPIGDHNCLTVPFDQLLSEGFNTRQTDVRTAGSINTALQLVAVIFQLQSLVQFGGVSAATLDSTLVPYIRKSFSKYFVDEMKDRKPNWKKQVPKELRFNDPEFTKKKYRKIYNAAMRLLIKETHQAVEAMYHNLNTLQSRSGNQLPFSSINFGLCTEPEGRLLSKEFLEVCREGLGKYHRTSIFPCVIFQCKKGVNVDPKDPNYDLFKLALQCTSERLYPNYGNCDWSVQKKWVSEDREIKNRVINELSKEDKNKLIERVKNNKDLQYVLALDENAVPLKEEQRYEVFSTMGCRTVNGSDINFEPLYRRNIKSVIDTGKPICRTLKSSIQKDGRGNICPTTIILPTIAMEADRDVNKFFKLLNKKLEEAKDSLIDRFNWICSQPWESARFMYENHVMAGYIPKEGIRSALQHGTVVIGLIGMAETLELLVDCNQTKPDGMELAKRICQLYKDRCAEYKKKYSLNFGVYYTPAENLCYTSMKKFQAQYGIIPKVSDHEFFTNSIHVPVWEKVDALKKIKIESELTGYSSAGCITYVELDASVKNNTKALEEIVDYAMENDIPYLALNLPNDVCMNCGLQQEIPGACPRCGSTNIQRLRRVTGYLSTDYSNFNKGKIAEVEARVKHTGVNAEL